MLSIQQLKNGQLWKASLFVSGYMIAWSALGVVAYYAFAAFEKLLQAMGEKAGWLGALLLVIAGIYQRTPFKDACPRHCRSPMGLLSQYTGFGGRASPIVKQARLNHSKATPALTSLTQF